MGEANQDENRATEAQQEEKPEEKAEKGDGETNEETKPSEPVVLHVDMHCIGCAKKVERTILKARGVEEVKLDMVGNQVAVKGMIDPQALCTRVERKTKRRASVISPLPAKDEDNAKAELVNAQASGEMSTVVLNVNMHCEPCALQLQKRILRMRGVQMAEADFATGNVTVTGTMDANKLVDYVYKRTRKQANVIPPPPPEAKEEKNEEKMAEEAEAEDKKEEKPEDMKEEGKESNSKEEEKQEEAGKEEKKKEEDNATQKEEVSKNNEEENGGGEAEAKQVHLDDTAKKMIYYGPIYVIERVYPPQIFSDENPNACCVL